MSEWKPIEISTPEAWHGFYARQIGASSYGIGCAISWHAWYFGFQIIGAHKADVGGFALALGPLWIGIGKLRPALPHSPTG